MSVRSISGDNVASRVLWQAEGALGQRPHQSRRSPQRWSLPSWNTGVTSEKTSCFERCHTDEEHIFSFVSQQGQLSFGGEWWQQWVNGAGFSFFLSRNWRWQEVMDDEQLTGTTCQQVLTQLHRSPCPTLQLENVAHLAETIAFPFSVDI